MRSLFTLIILLICFIQSNAQFNFQDQKFIPILGNGYEIKSGDLDGDGDQDLVISTQERGYQLYALINSGNSISDELIPITPELSIIGQYYLPFTIGDFDNDGSDEVAYYTLTQESSTKRLSIYKYNGTQFNAVVTLNTPNSGARQIAHGDFNKDGKLDLMYLVDKVYLLESNPQGSYTEKIIQTPQLIPHRITIADIDNDTWPDLIVNDSNFKISIYKNNNGSGFTFNQSIGAAGTSIKEILINDFNGDSKKDMIITFFNGLNNIDYEQQNPDGTFLSSNIGLNAELSLGLDSYDYNNDGKPDIIVGGSSNIPSTTPGLVILKNNGSSFDELFFPHHGINAWDLKPLNLYGDDKIEIAIMNAGKNLIICNLTSQLTMQQNIPYAYLTNNATTQDFNNDGLDDILSSNLMSQSLSITFNLGDGNYSQPEYHFIQGSPGAVASGDFNNDGFPDILYSINYSSNPIGIILSGVNGALGEPQSMSGSSGISFTINDFNNDGNLDFYNGSSVFYGNGDGTFVFYSPGEFNSIGFASGDFNTDGFADLMIASPSGLSLLNGKNAYTLEAVQNILTIKTPVYLVAKDINGDQRIDILSNNLDGSVSQFINQANGTYTEKVIGINGNGNALTTADFNLDTFQDLAVLVNNNKVSIFTGNAAGDFEFFKDYPTTEYYSQIFTSRQNDDSKPDLVLTNSYTPISIFLNDAVIEPSVFPSNLNATEITDISVKLNLEKGDGNGRIVIMREQSSSSSLPVDNQFYIPDTIFGKGSTVSDGNYVIMADNSTGTIISGLKENTEYSIYAFEYSSNSKKTLINYYQGAAASITFKTLKSQVITAPNISAKLVSDPSFTFLATASSNLPVVIELISGGVTFDNGIVTIQNPGPVKFKLTQPGNNDYMSAPIIEVTFCINPEVPTIISTESTNGKYKLTSSSTVNNIWLKNDVVIEGQTGQTIEVAPDAAYKVKVDYSGCYSTSSQIAAQIITVPEFTVTADATNFTIEASSNSSLEITYEVLEGGIEINNSTISIIYPGPAKIKASQRGNNDFFPITSFVISFCVNPKVPTITTTSSGPGLFTLTSSSDINNIWLRNGEAITGAANKTYQPLDDGVYSVKVDYSGCSSTSLPTAYIITALHEFVESNGLFPNPTTGMTVLELPNQNQALKKVLLYDLQGKGTELMYQVENNRISIDISNFSTGLYQILLQTESATIQLKVIKK